MLEFGSRISLPATYRMSLALSVALLAHTLIGGVIVVLMASDVAQKPSSHLNLTLVSRGHQPQQPSDNSNLVESVPISATDSPAAPPRPVRTSRSQNSPEPRPAPPKPEPAQTTKHQQTPVSEPKAVPSHDYKAGKASPLDGETEAAVSQLSPSSQSQPPTFVEVLAVRIAREMGRNTVQVPKQNLRGALQPIELELKLMKNGTLIQADVIRTSGVQNYDQSAVRAALRASPYPKPPKSTLGDGLRYRVILYLEPASP